MSKLKSLKNLQISWNGCVYFDQSVYVKTYKKYNFLNNNLFPSLPNETSSTLINSNLFYRKYRNHIAKKSENEFTTNCKKYSKFI